MHLDASTFAANQTCLSERSEVLREGRSRDGFFADVHKIRAIFRTLGAYDVGIDRHPHGVGEGVQDTLDGHVIERGMKKGLHAFSTIPAVDSLFNSSYYRNNGS